MIEKTTIESKNRIEDFFIKVKHCFKMLRSNEYVFINLDCKKVDMIELDSLNTDSDSIKRLFSSYLLKSYEEKYTKEQIDKLMSEVNERTK
ncbi:hypothetical protein FLJC2902T_17230 [Flavobacterium limnosediminis JC2902]|uniref:Uncharacterized protein n=1 Tax=Flavobacterium limnosediminis JC2902 TaxID=1341181 RepID=V6SQ81_9FLAO|nr:hypothetical protein [Flavobacterium limnosediminis]ESU28372.1 hypothetical protein FLJC2902T_17230 [Flavobacterium limnosediminis JC2902]